MNSANKLRYWTYGNILLHAWLASGNISLHASIEDLIRMIKWLVTTDYYLDGTSGKPIFIERKLTCPAKLGDKKKKF